MIEWKSVFNPWRKSFKATAYAPRILILRGGALGDFILTLPAIRALRRNWPSATIELIGHPGLGELALTAGLINRVRSLDASGMAQWFVPHRVWSERERADIVSFDLILSYLSDADGVVQANLRAAGAKRVMACSPVVVSGLSAPTVLRHSASRRRERLRQAGHATDYFLHPVTGLGISEPMSDEPLLAWPEALREQGRHWLKELGLTGNVISLHPGSGSSRKNWPIEQFALLADSVRRSMSAQPLFILGEADTAAARALLRLAPSVPVLTNRTLKEVASVLAVSRGYVGNDSGITHLAAVLGIPVVALFGPTDAAVWGPRGAKVVILQGRMSTWEALAAIEPVAVLQALENLIAECGLRNAE